MRTILFASMIGCGSDIAIITTEKRPIDTSVSTIDETGEPTSQAEEPSSEPASEMTDLTIGFAEISLTQIAGPA